MLSVVIPVLILVSLGIVVLRSVMPSLFPVYYIYLVLGIAVFLIFISIDYETLTAFSSHLFVLSILFLIIPILVGKVTRGTIRWIPVAGTTLQPSEIVRPFLLLFFAEYLTRKAVNIKRAVVIIILAAVPILLILFQPSLGVAALTTAGFLGVIFSAGISKKYLVIFALFFISIFPVAWQFLKPYQKDRVLSFLSPQKDYFGQGYNSIQATISVGGGGTFGKGLGRGVQTQLDYLPERHTDFIFASVAEEMGMVGAVFVILTLLFLILKLINLSESAVSPSARGYISGLVLILFMQSFVHIGMNMGLLPITGVPLPFVSAGGSSLLGGIIGIAIAIKGSKR